MPASYGSCPTPVALISFYSDGVSSVVKLEHGSQMTLYRGSFLLNSKKEVIDSISARQEMYEKLFTKHIAKKRRRKRGEDIFCNTGSK